ncbi:MAG: hypothetical protein ACREP8_05445 [Candidatus Binatia bacterium]
METSPRAEFRDEELVILAQQEGRALALTTNRAVCVAMSHSHLAQRDLRKIFPGFKSPSPILQWKV